MDVKALLLIGGTDEGVPSISGRPIATLDVLGVPVVQHIAAKLRRFGVTALAAVCDCEQASVAARQGIDWQQVKADSFWRTAEQTFTEWVQGGTELVLIVRLGAYADLDFEQLVQFHLDQRSRVTQVVSGRGPLDIYVVSGSRRNDAAVLLRSGLSQFRTSPVQFPFSGYVNPLANAGDLRTLARDGLMQRAGITPAGKERKPGVWVAPSARLERGIRIVAPAYIGERARVRAGALITRGSNVEHHAVVDCGTVLEDATVLPYTYLGAGLEVAHSVAGFRSIISMKRGVAVELVDPTLIDDVPESVSVRAMKKTAALLSFVPAQFARGLRTAGRRAPVPLEPVPAAAAVTENPTYGADASAAPKFPGLAVARRYGNQ